MRLLESHAYLDEDARRRHATMVLGGWTFEPMPVRTRLSMHTTRYVAKNPRGDVKVVNSTLLTAVDSAWFTHGGNGS
jgi:hypothetical protein